jgi:3-phosphoshikimate 1-carboxyvinyltransferase
MKNMAFLKVKPSKLSGEVAAPPSKSYTHRAFVIASLAEGESKIRNPLISYDTQATIDAVRALGAEVVQEGRLWKVRGTGGKIKAGARVIDAKNSGTTLRFLSAVAALSPDPVELTGDSSLLRRPMGPLIEALQKLGARGRCGGADGRPPVVVSGGLSGGEAEVSGAVSSQFISALLLAAPYAKEDVRLTITEELRSKPYVEITLELLEAAGAVIKRDKGLTNFKIPGEQIFRPLDLEIPGDFSSASFVLGGAALTGSSVQVKNLDMRGAQGDKRILEFLQEFGAEVFVKGKTVQVSGSGELSGVDLDCGDNPDLVPILAVLGSLAEGRTSLGNVPHLRVKESNRIRVLSVGLRKLGARVEELPDGLRLKGVRELRGAELSSLGDHRMAMAFAVAGLVARGQTTVDGAESIPVSYPNFVEDMQKLGAKIELVK